MTEPQQFAVNQVCRWQNLTGSLAFLNGRKVKVTRGLEIEVDFFGRSAVCYATDAQASIGGELMQVRALPHQLRPVLDTAAYYGETKVMDLFWEGT